MIAQVRKYRDLLRQIDNSPEAMSHVDLQREAKDLSAQLHFALVLVTPKESVGDMIVRNVAQGEGAVAWRMLMDEYAANEPGNVLAACANMADLEFQPETDIVVGVNKRHEYMAWHQKRFGETLPDTISRRPLIHALSNEPELQRRVMRNTARIVRKSCRR